MRDSGSSIAIPFPWLAVGALLLVNALWGISFPLVKGLNTLCDARFGVSPESETNVFRLLTSAWLLATRFTLAFVLLAVFGWRWVRQATQREWVAGATIGVFFFLGLVLQVIGLATIPASRSGFLTSLTTVFTPLFAVLVFRVFPSRWMVAGAGLAIFGVMVLTGLVEIDAGGVRLAADASQRWTWGDSLTTVGSMFFAVQVLMLDHFGRRMRSVAFTPGMFLVTAILGWLCVAAILGTELRTGTGVPDMRWADWWELSLRPAFLVCLGVLAFFCSILSFGMMNQFQPYVSASQASVIYAVEPVCASLWALILPGYLSRLADVPLANETLSWNLVLGGVLILAANVVALFPSRDNHDYLGKLP